MKFKPIGNRLVIGARGAGDKNSGANPQLLQMLGKYGGAGENTLPTDADDDEVAERIIDFWRADPKLQIYLAGYSRGGNFMVDVADQIATWAAYCRQVSFQ